MFLTDDPPDPLATPPSLEFGVDDMTTPGLQQEFVIGSKVDSVRVPRGATRLFFGLHDGWEWSNNVGEMTVVVMMPGEPARMVQFSDFAKFVEQWLWTGNGLASDIDEDDDVDAEDLIWLAHFWLCYCPMPWPSK